MIGIISQRFFHATRVNMNSGISALGKLRRSTGYSMSNCKKALELFPGDVSKAEEWLHAEAKQKGWAKWAKVQTRIATQGLIGAYSKDNTGVMVEVNCETDFVAKNAEFQQFVETVLFGCICHASSLHVNGFLSKVLWNEVQLNALKFQNSTLGELVAAAVLKFNEKMVMKRAVFLKVGDGLGLTNLSHPTILCPGLKGGTLGKYGALLAYKKTSEKDIDISEVGYNICQHIIGMNPLSLGQLTEEDILNMNKEKLHMDDISVIGEKEISSDIKEELGVVSSEETEAQDTVIVKDTDETRLLFQPYLLDSNVIVGETLLKSGMEVIDFERFECGEGEKDATIAAAASS